MSSKKSLTTLFLMLVALFGGIIPVLGQDVMPTEAQVLEYVQRASWNEDYWSVIDHWQQINKRADLPPNRVGWYAMFFPGMKPRQIATQRNMYVHIARKDWAGVVVYFDEGTLLLVAGPTLGSIARTGFLEKHTGKFVIFQTSWIPQP